MSTTWRGFPPCSAGDSRELDSRWSGDRKFWRRETCVWVHNHRSWSSDWPRQPRNRRLLARYHERPSGRHIRSRYFDASLGTSRSRSSGTDDYAFDWLRSLGRAAIPDTIENLQALSGQVECRPRLAAAPSGDPRAHRRLDSRRDEFSEAGSTLGRRRAPVLRHLGQGRQLSSRDHRGAVDGRARVDAGRGLVCARGVVDARRAAACANPRDGALPREMALGARVGAAGAGQRRAGHGGAGRCGIRGQRDAASDLHRAKLPYALGISSHLTVFREREIRRRPRGAARSPKQLPPARVARRHVAQWHQPAVESPLRGAAGDARPTLAVPPSCPRGLALVRTGSRCDAAHQALLRRVAGHRLAARPGAVGASPVGHRAAAKSSKTNWDSTTSRDGRLWGGIATSC